MREQRIASPRGGPDERHGLLLGALTWSDERARDAWERWRSLATPDALTDAEARLLAAAYRPLRRLGVDDPMVTLAGGVYRRAWYVNQLALNRTAGVIAGLRAAGLEVLALDGTALAVLHYRDVGARPTEAIDLLVRLGELDAASDALQDMGWRANARDGRNGTRVFDRDGDAMELHTYVSTGPADDTLAWQTRTPFELAGVRAYALGPAEQLVHVFAQRIPPDETPTVLWAADSNALLRSAGGALDWRRVVQLAHKERLAVALGGTLEWLRESLGADIPSSVLGRLCSG